jgi:hypothetical protein
LSAHKLQVCLPGLELSKQLGTQEHLPQRNTIGHRPLAVREDGFREHEM